MAIVHKPNKRKRARTHGFLSRMESSTGRNIIKRRMKKGRARITV